MKHREEEEIRDSRERRSEQRGPTSWPVASRRDIERSGSLLQQGAERERGAEVDEPSVSVERPKTWPAELLAALGSWPDEIERPEQEPISKLADPFQ